MCLRFAATSAQARVRAFLAPTSALRPAPPVALPRWHRGRPLRGPRWLTVRPRMPPSGTTCRRHSEAPRAALAAVVLHPGVGPTAPRPRAEPSPPRKEERARPKAVAALARPKAVAARARPKAVARRGPWPRRFRVLVPGGRLRSLRGSLLPDGEARRLRRPPRLLRPRRVPRGPAAAGVPRPRPPRLRLSRA